MYDILVIGSSTRDVFMKSEGHQIIQDKRFPAGLGQCFGLGSKVEIKKIVFTTGGGGTNAAVTFARQGLKTACIGVVGNDFNGQEVLEELNREGIDTQYFVKHSDDFTAYSVIMVNEDAERTILSYKGEGQHFSAANVPFDKIQAKWLFLDSLGGHYDLLESAVNWAVKNGVKISTNPGGKELAHGLDKLKPLLKHFNIVGMNQEEAAELTGIDFEKEKEIFKFMDEIIDGIFIMSKGPKGVVVSDGKNLYRAGVPDSPVVERTGAGDAFHSGFASEIIRSGDIVKAIQLATANSSSVVTQYGSKAGILKGGDMGPWPLVQVEVEKL
jgi:ribokinase